VQLQEHGIASDYLRIRALPPSALIKEFLRGHQRNYLIEQNRDGQMRAILSMEFPGQAARLRSVLHYTGLPIDARFITNSILEQEKEEHGKNE